MAGHGKPTKMAELTGFDNCIEPGEALQVEERGPPPRSVVAGRRGHGPSSRAGVAAG